ncbi:MAG: S1 RNA-binding domain-containing protein, partial [Clostridia bacterium]|nr:S1 RNA-binding domain-containing protein [Clostridia bacterium]
EEDGTIYISSFDKEAIDAARTIIGGIVFEPEIGAIYTGRVTRIIPIGAFVEFAPKKEGMVHISKLDKKRTEKVEDVCNVGDRIRVKFLGTDEKGRFNLSRRDAMDD